MYQIAPAACVLADQLHQFRECEDIGADMIALATHGRTGIMHLLSGSIAEDIVNHAKRPVWTCKLKI